jgi:PAS domain S-box-containing protein
MISLLYIDDEPGLLELGKLFLESAGGFEVSTAESGDEGLGQLAQHDFDAIVSDFQMPGMDGIELLKKVRKTFGTIPFVLFTGRGREEVVIEAINNGVDFYLQKGGDPKAQFAELAHKVRQSVSRRRAETALSDSEKRLADIINFLPDATFAIDTRGVVIAWNRAMERMTGVRAEDVLGKGDYEYALPFYHERRPLLINLVLENDPAIGEKYPFVKKEGRNLFSEIRIPHFNDGRGAALWFTASPLYDRKGEIAGAIESIRDITERKRAEEARNESEKRFRELADLLPQGIYEADTDGRMIYANRLALEMYGYTDEDVEKGLNVLNVIAPVDRKRAVTVFSKMVETGTREQGKEEYLAVRKDGGLFPVSIYTSPVHRDGRICGVRGVVIDITDRKRTEEELRAANEQLVASEEELRAQYDELASGEKRIRMSESHLRYMLGFDEYAKKSERELLGYAIEGSGIVTGSTLAYLAFLNEDESELAMYAWSKIAMAECSLREKPLVYSVDKTGLWGEAVRQRHPVITNDYAAPNPAKKGYPEGHPRIIRHMNVPVIDDGHIVLIAGVANKPSDYTENDVNELLLLGQGLWNIIKRRRAEETLRESEEKYRNLVEQSRDTVFIMQDGRLVFYNQALAGLTGHTADELKGQLLADIIAPEDRDMVILRMQERARGNMVPELYELSLLHKDGKSRIRIRVHAGMASYKGRPASIGIFHNITKG